MHPPPHAAGPTSTIAARIDQAFDSALAERRIVGAVVMVAREGEPIYARAAGMADRENAIAMGMDTIFRLSSVTKPIVAIAALRLVERGRLHLADPVTKWLPDFRPALPDGRVPVITIRHLLAHTAGLGTSFTESAVGPRVPPDGLARAGRPGLSLAENLQKLAGVPLLYAPGHGWRYSIAMDVLGGVIEQETAGRLGEAVAALVTRPLGLRDTSFHVTDRRRTAAPYKSGSPEPQRMQTEDMIQTPTSVIRFATERIFDPLSFHSGGGGMAGTAGDVLAILEVIRKGGTPLLTEETVTAMTRDQSDGLMRQEQPGQGFGFGWAVVTDPGAAALPHSPGTLQWGGVYGHSWFVDPAQALTVVVLTNTALEGLFGRFATDIRDAAYAAS